MLSTINLTYKNSKYESVETIKQIVLDTAIKYITMLHNHKTTILKSASPNDYLSDYTIDKCPNAIFLPAPQAIERLHTFQNGIFHDLILAFEKLNFETMIAGSSGLASVLKSAFEPKDIDIYIKNITHSKIESLDRAIRSVFPSDRILCIRRPLTLTWWIYDPSGHYKTEIQLNMLYIQSFAEVFIVYHTDAVCIGYEIKTKKFITLTRRWGIFLRYYPQIIFTNVNSNAPADFTENAAQKYRSRGFICRTINIVDTTPSPTLSSNPNNAPTNPHILHHLVTTYKSCDDILISDTIEHLYQKDKLFPRFIKIESLADVDPFLKYLTDFQHPNAPECPIIMENYNIACANVNCTHEISLKAYILMGTFTQCPLCRTIFEPCIINSITQKKADCLFTKAFNEIGPEYHHPFSLEAFNFEF